MGRVFRPFGEEVMVDAVEARGIEDAFSSSSVHATCIGVIFRALFEKGFEFFPREDMLKKYGKSRKRITPDTFDSSDDSSSEESEVEEKNPKKRQVASYNHGEISDKKLKTQTGKGFVRKSVKANTEDDMLYGFLKAQYEPAVKLAYLDYLKFGYAVVSYEDHTCEYTGFSSFRPVNVNIDQVRVFAVPSENSLSYRWVAREVNDTGITKNRYPLLVLAPCPEFAPSTTTGEHRSPLAVTLSDITFVTKLEEEFLAGVKVRSTPIMIIEHNPEVLRLSKEINEPLPGMPDLQRRYKINDKISEKLGRDQSDTQKSGNPLQKSEDHAAYMSGGSALEKMYNSQTRKSLRARAYDLDSDNTKILPVSLKMAQTQPHIPQALPELIRFQEALREKIVAMYGIPPSMVMFAHNAGQKQSVQTADVQDEVIFKRTIRQGKNVVTNMFKMIYRFICHDRITVNQIPFDINLNITQLAHPEQLFRNHQQGFIDHDKLKSLILEATGLDETDGAKGEVDIAYIPVNGTERQTTQRQKADLRVSIAEAKNKEADAKKKQGEVDMQKEQRAHDMAMMDKQMKLEEIKIDGQLKAIAATNEGKKLDLKNQARAAKKQKT